MMNELSSKRREWVKNAAIIFLSVMLVLTFFSNTIMNYSLPEVSAQYVQPGTVTAKIRGNGIVESKDPYNIKIKSARKVDSIEVLEGDMVEKGQVLCYLSSEDSKELEEAKEELAKAESAFEGALLTGEVDADVMNNAGNTDSLQNYKAKIIRLQNEKDAIEAEMKMAKNKVDEWKNKAEEIMLQIALNNANTVAASNEKKAFDEAKDVLENATFAWKDAQNKQNEIRVQIELQNTVSDGDAIDFENIEVLEQKLLEADKLVNDAQVAVNSAELNYQKTEAALKKKEEELNLGKENQIAGLEVQHAQIQIEISKAEKTYSDKEETFKLKEAELTEAVQKIKDEINLGNLYDEIEKAKEKIKALEVLAEGNEVVAPISGTVIEVRVQSGLDTPDDGILFTMQPQGEGYTLSISVTNEQAKRVSVGDYAEPVNAWRYDDLEILLHSIKPDTSNPSQNKILVFQLSGEDIVPNQSINISVGEKSGNYDYVVPNSAIREDNNGKFVLIVDSKSSPIGTRYTARREDVEVLASDETHSAISGALEGYEFVITTSTKPVQAGQQIRLSE